MAPPDSSLQQGRGRELSRMAAGLEMDRRAEVGRGDVCLANLTYGSPSPIRIGHEIRRPNYSPAGIMEDVLGGSN